MSGFSSTPGPTINPDGTPASPPHPDLPGVTIEEYVVGGDLLDAESQALEPGAPGSDESNISVPALSTGDAEHDGLLAELDEFLAEQEIDTGYAEAADADAQELVDAAEYADELVE